MAEQLAKASEPKVPARPEDITDPFVRFREKVERVVDRFSGGREAWPFSGKLRPFEWRMSAFAPRVDIKDLETRIKIEAELPGFSEKDVEASFCGNSVIIRGEKQQETAEQEKGYYRVERAHGSFQRSIPLPVEVEEDKIRATFKNGVLTIILPKSREAMEQTKKIPILTEEMER